MDELLREETSEVIEDRADDVLAEVLDDNTIETAEVEETPAVVDEVVETVETENPVEDETVFEDSETITAEEIQGETAEPQSIETVEDVTEEVEAEEDPEDTPVIEEAVIPDYIRRASEVGTRENPIFAPCGREVTRPSLLQ